MTDCEICSSEGIVRLGGNSFCGECATIWQQLTDSPATVDLEPDDWGSCDVQENGMLYVGREYAGESVRWLIERESGD